MKIHSGWLAAIVLLGLSLGGCAFGDRQANLQYPPKQDSGTVVKSAEATTMTPAAIASAPTIAILRFSDDRAEQNVVGHVRNGWGMKTADVLSPTDVSAWVSDALKFELEKVGFRVKQVTGTGDAAAAEADAAISGQVIRMYADAYFSYEGEVTLRAEIAKDGSKVMDRLYTGTAGGGLNMAATGASYAHTLSLALQDGLQEVVADIIREVGK